jgi:hypothetical protein
LRMGEALSREGEKRPSWDGGELPGKKAEGFAVKIERHAPLYHKKVRL